MENILKLKLWNQRGDGNLVTVLFTLFSLILLSVMTTWIAVGAETVQLRNAIKQELAEVSIQIESDTYKALREGNLAAYNRTLTSDPDYHEMLKQLVEESIEQSLGQTVDPTTGRTAGQTGIISNGNNYVIDNIDLSFRENADNIEYTLSCDVTMYISFVGRIRTVRTESISLTGRHSLIPYS